VFFLNNVVLQQHHDDCCLSTGFTQRWSGLLHRPCAASSVTLRGDWLRSWLRST